LAGVVLSVGDLTFLDFVIYALTLCCIVVVVASFLTVACHHYDGFASSLMVHVCETVDLC